jgi:alkylation response protein AidB-like acyl-CoA dehydrogenase
MDFMYHYSDEQDQFRKEVRVWVDAIPDEMREPIDQRDATDEMYWWWREKHKETAAKGWLYPSAPKEYGGGGLTTEQSSIIQEEFERGGVPYIAGRLNPIQFLISALLVWGTEDQKRKFLVPILNGTDVAWEKMTEPQSGADNANYQGTAIRDGDDWILNGVNCFTSGRGPAPDWLYGPMLTDPDAPRHRNLGFFMIPVPTPGLEIRSMHLVHGSEQHFDFLDNVRVPGDHLIGGDHQGWQVVGTVYEHEHGGRGHAFFKDEVVDNLVSYVKDTKQNGEALSSDPLVRQETAGAYLDAHVQSLLNGRTHWMYNEKAEMTYEGSLNGIHRSDYSERNTYRVRGIMGMGALLGTREPAAPHGGAQGVSQIVGCGSNNIGKLIVARRIGISRTKERAAPTPATAAGQAA